MPAAGSGLWWGRVKNTVSHSGICTCMSSCGICGDNCADYIMVVRCSSPSVLLVSSASSRLL